MTATSTSKYATTNTAETSTTTFDVVFNSPCNRDDLTTVTATAQTNPDADQYTGTDFTFTYASFDVIPSYCDLTISCLAVNPTNTYVPC